MVKMHRADRVGSAVAVIGVLTSVCGAVLAFGDEDIVQLTGLGFVLGAAFGVLRGHLSARANYLMWEGPARPSGESYWRALMSTDHLQWSRMCFVVAGAVMGCLMLVVF